MFTFLKENFRSVFLLLLAALLIFLYLWFFRQKAKDPVPTFKVSAGSILVTPDKSLGADLVKISAFDAQGTPLANGELVAPFDTSFNINFGNNVDLVRVKMDYLKSGKIIGCPPFDETIVIPPVGVPIITTDVPVGRSSTSFTSNNWCDCDFGPGGVLIAHPCPSPTTHWEFSIGTAASAGKYKVEVTKNTTIGGVTGTPVVSRFIISIDNPTGGMNVLYYTGFNMSCTSSSLVPALSNDADFSLQAFNKLIYYNTSSLKYTCQVQKKLDCTGLQSDRVIVVKCDDTPPPSSTIVNYSVTVTKASTACGDGSL